MRPRVLLALAATLAALGCDGRKAVTSSGKDKETPRKSGPALAVFDLTAGAPEQATQSLFGFGPKHPAFDELVAALERAQKDKDVRGVFVRFGLVSLGMARAMRLGEGLARLRDAGRPVHCHAENLSNATLYAAARGCSRIAVSPAGDVDSVGLAAQVVYMRKLLADELHIQIDILQVGKSKGAAEPLTRDGPSEEARASLEGTLADMRASWLEGIVKGRGKPHTDLAAEDGPYSPEAAIARGLCDEVSYADEARESAKKGVGAVRESVRFGPNTETDGSEDLSEFVRLLASDGEKSGPVALVKATGSIAMAASGGPMGGRVGITEKELGRTIAKLEKDDAVKAVVLRIDSPGGSALASDLLWHGLMKLRAKKPIVVSVGEMAASGGYYLASTANVIFAQPGSIVGSIGVVGGKVGLGGALERWGVHAETFSANKDPKAAQRAAYMSMLVGWDDATRSRVLERMTGIYDLFLKRVSEGRKMPVARVAESAEGKIFSGREAKQRGLVDELGGLSQAIAKAKELAKLDPGAEVVVFGGRSPLEALAPGGSEGGDDEGRAASRALAIARELAPDLAAHASALAPLLDGEAAVVALPYAITVR